MTDLFLGIDLGGTNVKIGVCAADGSGRRSLSIPTLPERGPQDTVDRMAAAAKQLLQSTGPARACASGLPGPLDPERRKLLRANNLPGWIDVPYPDLLGRALGIPTWMENDSNCAAWGEYVAGSGRGARSLVLYTLGTGVGGGIVIDGELWVGASGAAGELGHMVVHPDGPKCGCPQSGCLEQYASASAVSRKWGRGSAKDCFDAAARGDREALAVLDWSAAALSLGVANAIHVLHPDVVVLAGGMAQAGAPLLDRVRDGVRRLVYASYMERIRIELSQVPRDDAGWLGAALWAARRAAA